MDLTAISTLHAYDAWANARVCAALAGPGVPERAKRSFGHIIAALELWWARYAGTPLGCWEAFPALDAGAAAERLERIGARWASALATLSGGDLDREIAFTDSRGAPQRDRIGDFLVHLATHGTHHRGQVLSHLRAAGLTPPAIDYMVYYRARRTA